MFGAAVTSKREEAQAVGSCEKGDVVTTLKLPWPAQGFVDTPGGAAAAIPVLEFRLRVLVTDSALDPKVKKIKMVNV